jgi:uncharacterized protein (DUF1697 family)
MASLSARARQYVVLLRGINVGKSKRIAMADLRALLERLGYENVRTVMQSGNAVVGASSAPESSTIGDALFEATGVRAGVIVIPGERFLRAIDANPLLEVSTDPSRAIITFLEKVPDAADVSRPTDEELLPERLAFGEDAIYQWFPDGVLSSKLPAKFFERLGSHATGRNLRTADKIAALLKEPPPAG